MSNSSYTQSPPPYRIPPGPSEGQRLLGHWSSFSRLVKTGIIGGGLLTLTAVGAIAAPLVTGSEAPKHLPFVAQTEARTSPGAGNKVAEPTRPAANLPSVEPTKVSPSPSPTETKTEPTKAPTTKATEPTKAPTTKATEPVKTSTTPVATTPVPTTAKPTTTTPKPTTTSPTAKPTVVAGTTCTVSGALGVTSAGAAMICKTTTTDVTLRWRAA